MCHGIGLDILSRDESFAHVRIRTPDRPGHSLVTVLSRPAVFDDNMTDTLRNRLLQWDMSSFSSDSC